MNKIIVSLLAILFSAGCCFSQDNTLTAKEKNDGWKLLFDGKTTNGWHSYGKETATKAWSVKDGTFYLDAEALKGLNFMGVPLSRTCISIPVSYVSGYFAASSWI